MGLINFFRRHAQRRRVRRRFRSYADPALIEWAIANPGAGSPAPASMVINFVVALLRDETLSDVPAVLEEVSRVAGAHGGLVENLVGPVVFVTFGAVGPDADAAAHRRAFVGAVAGALGDRVKVVHGSGVALVGEVAGGASAFGSAVRGFSGLMAELAALAFGEVREVSL